MIRQFDVFKNPSTVSQATSPYLLILQSHHLAALNTVIAAPLIESSLLQPDLVVLLPIEIAEQSYTLDLTVMGAVPAARLTSRVANLIQMEDVIRRGLDRIFTGF